MANKTPEEKIFLNHSGKFAVISELLKRCIDARITIGNLDQINVQVFYKDGTVKTVEVKTSDTNRIVTRFWQKYFNKEKRHPDYWVLVHVDKNKAFHYYVYKHDDLGKLQNEVNGHLPDGNGCDNIDIKHLSDNENDWDLIIQGK